jgi:hypothetical protein
MSDTGLASVHFVSFDVDRKNLLHRQANNRGSDWRAARKQVPGPHNLRLGGEKGTPSYQGLRLAIQSLIAHGSESYP